ncbi:MAG: C1 family peptidase [Candidatus Omnitrophica bacterium]|nr:C1 family peptidase [Candidatus Omnitrophota bacterium]
MMKKMKRYFGWLPDVPDQRDFLYRAIRPRFRLPSSADLREGCSAVEDQGPLGSCTAQALAGNVEFLDNLDDKKYVDVSRLFIYYNERALRGMEDTDSGAMLRDGIKTLAKTGVCHESIWPYLTSKFAQKPPAACYRQAGEHRILSYHRLTTLNEMLTCLADGFPFVLGIAVYESFETEEVAKTGVVPMPKKDERQVGGHAVMAVGYQQKAKRFIVRNSWGTSWGQQGYFTLPFAYVETLAADFWTIRE